MVIVLKNYKNARDADLDIFVNSFIGTLTKDGHFNFAFKLYKELLEFIKVYTYDEKRVEKGIKLNPVSLFLQGFISLTPDVGLRNKKIAGINYQLPCPITEGRAYKTVIKWFFSSMEIRKEKNIFERIKEEFLDIFKSKGLTFIKKISFERIALENRIFLHFLKKKINQK